MGGVEAMGMWNPCEWLFSNLDYLGGGVIEGFADSGYRAFLGAEMRKSIIISADCGYWPHLCGMQLFLQN